MNGGPSSALLRATRKLHVSAPKPLKSALRTNSGGERSARLARIDGEEFLRRLHPAKRVQADQLERPAALAGDRREFGRDENGPAERLA